MQAAESSPRGAQGCGKTTVNGADSFPFGLVPAKGVTVSPSGKDAALLGLVLHDDPLTCPNDSADGNSALTAGSTDGMKKLDNASVGDVVELHGDSSITASDPIDFNVAFDQLTSGSQHVSVDWSLKLRRLRKRG